MNEQKQLFYYLELQIYIGHMLFFVCNFNYFCKTKKIVNLKLPGMVGDNYY